MQPVEAAVQYGTALKALMGEKGRPLHPALAGVWEGWVDPSARPSQPKGGSLPQITAEERSWMSVLGEYGAEGCAALLTPYGLALMAECALTYIALTNEELAHGYHGLEGDPWGEVRHVPAEARDQFARALWHINEGLLLAGLRPAEAAELTDTPKEA